MRHKRVESFPLESARQVYGSMYTSTKGLKIVYTSSQMVLEMAWFSETYYVQMLHFMFLLKTKQIFLTSIFLSKKGYLFNTLHHYLMVETKSFCYIFVLNKKDIFVCTFRSV